MSWTNERINYVLTHPDKTADRNFLKGLATSSEDELLGMNYLIMDSDPIGIDLVISLMLCLYRLRIEFISWETERRRPGLSAKQYARIALKECAMNFADASEVEVMEWAGYVRNGIEDGAMDYICGLFDAVHELRDELSAWAEADGAAAATVLQ